MVLPLSREFAFLLGFLGAIAPEIYRTYQKRDQALPKKFSRFSFYVLSIIYAGMGGLIALACHPTSELAALYSGFAWPFIISGATHHKESAKDKKLAANAKPTDDVIRASDRTPSKFQNVKRRLQDIVELIQTHADALFL